MRRIAAGRASEIFDLGDGRVLRRFLHGGDAPREAVVMEHARARGYPVPAVHEVRDDGLVLALIEGRTMTDDLLARPERTDEHARLLASLHRQLHELEPPPGLSQDGEGKALLHLDLHPNNVILSPSGPVVVDWTNAARGLPALDPAMIWTILAPLPQAAPFLAAFLAEFDAAELRAALPRAIEKRLADPSVTAAERDLVRALVAG